MAKLQTLSPEFLAECAATIERVKRLVKGGLSGDEPQPEKAPDDVIVMTPAGGIAARSGTTIYGELCDTYRITDADPTDDEITLESIVDGNDNPIQVKVFNLSNGDVGADRYVVTSRLKSGHRYVVVESCDAEA